MFETSFVVMKLMIVMMVFMGRASAAVLGSYGADSSNVSVSGVSSGANMAVQLHVAYSASIMGAGAVAGEPYYCARGSAYRASLGDCSAFGDPANVDISVLTSQTETYASSGKVDATSNLASGRVYIFSGTEDVVVPKGLVEKLEEYYTEFIPTATNIKTVYTIPVGHAFITKDYGSSCGTNANPYINHCNYNQAYEILNHIYGNLQEPSSSTTANGELLSFSQNEFFPTFPWLCGLYCPMYHTGYVYIPTGCASTQNCKLHVALHGCSQTKISIGNKFYTHTGYNEVGELNDIIILYPQVLMNPYLLNPLGCWDWWGYKGNDYATNTGWEMKAIKAMIDRILQ